MTPGSTYQKKSYQKQIIVYAYSEAQMAWIDALRKLPGDHLFRRHMTILDRIEPLGELVAEFSAQIWYLNQESD